MVFFFVARSVSLLWAGPYLDRFKKKTVMIFSEWGRAVAFLLLYIMYSSNNLEVWHITAVNCLLGLFSPLFQPAGMAYVAKVVPSDDLKKANSVIDSTSQTMMFLGPPLSGLLLLWIEADIIILMLVILLSVSGFIILQYLPEETEASNSKKEKWLTQFIEGIAFYRNNAFLLWMALLLVILNFVKVPSSLFFFLT